MSATGTVGADEAERIARELYGLVATATPLPGERDLNFRLDGAGGERAVLKLHHPEADRAALALQDAVLEKLAARGEPGAPRLLGPTAEVDGRPVRLLSWLPGRVWAQARPGPAQLAGLGRIVARIDRALAGFEHPAMRRPLLWNLLAAPEVARFASLVDAARRPLVEGVLARFEDGVAPRLAGLPHQVIHNDANEHNVVVGGDGTVRGLIDFGDTAWSVRVAGLAVAAAYAMQGRPDPVRAVVPVVRGYHEVAPLAPGELEVLFDLIRTRLAMSVCMAAWQHSAAPGNEYLLVSQDGVVRVLEQLAGEDAELAHFRYRDACGYEASPTARRVRQHFESGAAEPRPVLDADLATAPVLDLSGPARDMHAPVGVAIGRYDEERRIYTAPEFRMADGQFRTRHIGTDLFADAGTAVRAPLDGVIERRETRARPLDYGGVLVLRHATAGGVPFWTLFGHLDPDSTAAWETGAAVRAGDVIARLGAPEVNGGWPPHLHLQLFTALVGDLPGVALSEEADVWRSVCPDPNLLLGRREGDAARPARAPADVAHRRRTAMSRALSLSYREPLHIVRGQGAHLYDAAGNAYLDLVNNVAHVGHCHPRVVAAGQRQMAALNTNTRYLHASVIDYARRLAATLPDPLHVCFFVNSGSEANDLALRLAAAHTGRDEVLVLDRAYHGHLVSQIALSPYKAPPPPGTHVCAVPDPYRGTSADEALASLRAQIAAPAAFFAESLQGCGGQIVYPPGYLAAAFAEVRAAGGLCVADEVQVGFGRVGEHFWGFELGGAVPDIVTLGKPIGNGHPLGAVVTTPEVAASFATGMEYFNTFGGNPVSAEIGLAVLDVIRDERLQAHARERGEALLGGLRELAARHELIGDVRGHGLFLGVELSRDGAPATDDARRVKEALKARRVLISTDGPDDNVLKIKPPMVIGAADCERFLGALDAALAELRP